MAPYVTRLARYSPSGLGLRLHRPNAPVLSLFHVQRHPIKGLSHVLIWSGVDLSRRSAGASGLHSNELGDDSDILRDIMNEQPLLLHLIDDPSCIVMVHDKM